MSDDVFEGLVKTTADGPVFSGEFEGQFGGPPEGYSLLLPGTTLRPGDMFFPKDGSGLKIWQNMPPHMIGSPGNDSLYIYARPDAPEEAETPRIRSESAYRALGAHEKIRGSDMLFRGVKTGGPNCAEVLLGPAREYRGGQFIGVECQMAQRADPHLFGIKRPIGMGWQLWFVLDPESTEKPVKHPTGAPEAPFDNVEKAMQNIAKNWGGGGVSPAWCHFDEVREGAEGLRFARNARRPCAA